MKKNNSLKLRHVVPALWIASSLTVGTAYADASCQSVLQQQLDWLSQPASGTLEKHLLVSMVSNHADRFLQENYDGEREEATYFTSILWPLRVPTGLYSFQTVLFGEGNALFNNIYPEYKEQWKMMLLPSSNSMRLTRDDKTLNMLLGCIGNLATAVHSQYAQYGSFSVYLGSTRYVLSFTHFLKDILH